MPLTSSQLAALGADIEADQTLNALPMNDDAAFQIAAAYNAAASPAFTVWRTRVPVEEVMSNGFVWTAVDSLTAGKARIWEWMASLGYINPSKSNIRQGLVDAFGSGTAMANGILPHLKRSATRAEKLFATGTGSDASPATMSHEGSISIADVNTARSL